MKEKILNLYRYRRNAGTGHGVYRQYRQNTSAGNWYKYSNHHYLDKHIVDRSLLRVEYIIIHTSKQYISIMSVSIVKGFAPISILDYRDNFAHTITQKNTYLEDMCLSNCNGEKEVKFITTNSSKTVARFQTTRTEMIAIKSNQLNTRFYI